MIQIKASNGLNILNCVSIYSAMNKNLKQSVTKQVHQKSKKNILFDSIESYCWVGIAWKHNCSRQLKYAFRRNYKNKTTNKSEFKACYKLNKYDHRSIALLWIKSSVSVTSITLIRMCIVVLQTCDLSSRVWSGCPWLDPGQRNTFTI